LINPILHALAVLALFWAASPFMKGAGNDVLGLLFVSQLGVVSAFIAGRADHQSLIVLLFLLSLGCGIRILIMPPNRTLCFFSGAVSALAIWVSVESLLFSLLVYLVGGAFWLLGDRSITRKLLHYSLAIFLLLIAFRLIEFSPSRLFDAAFDQVSIVHITLFGLLLTFWALVYVYERLRGECLLLVGRLSIAVSGALVAGILMEFRYPGFFTGPMGSVDELFRQVYLVRIQELQPVISLRALNSGNLTYSLARFFLWLGIVFPGFAALVYLLAKSSGTSRMAWIYILIASFVYLPLAFFELRWTPYAPILMLPGYALLVIAIMQRISTTAASAAVAGSLRVTVLFISAVIFFVPSLIWGNTNSAEQVSKCPLIAVSRFLDDPSGLGDKPKNILALTDFGPELVYRTRHSVFSIPSHRFHKGFTDSYNIMTALDDTQAMEGVQQRKVNLILICPGGNEGYFYARGDGKETFHQRISEGRLPRWLEEIVLPAEAARSFRLYAVRDVSI
jgi:hypothetical protein